MSFKKTLNTLIFPKYKCQKCKREWVQKKPDIGPCNYCEHDWVDWLNYDEYIKQFKVKK